MRKLRVTQTHCPSTERRLETKLLNRLTTVIFSVLLVSLIGCASIPSKEGTGEYVDDTVVTVKGNFVSRVNQTVVVPCGPSPLYLQDAGNDRVFHLQANITSRADEYQTRSIAAHKVVKKGLELR